MKKTNLFLLSALSICLLASCGGSVDDGRSRSLAPNEDGAKTYEIDDGCSKLSRALKTMPVSSLWSFSTDLNSTFSSNGTITDTYDEEHKDSDSVSTYTLDVKNPVFEGSFSNMAGASIADVSAYLGIGGDIDLAVTENGGEKKTLKNNGASAKAYLDKTNVYLDLRGMKNLVSKTIKTFGGDSGALISGAIATYFNDGYYFAHNLTDENMPLVNESMFSDVDEYLSLFSDHSEDYKEFINVTGKDDTYSFYLTMNKEDLIRVLTDAQSKVEENVSNAPSEIDFATQLESSTVNAFEILVTFSAEAIKTVSFNIDMNLVTDTDITTESSSGTQVKIGTRNNNSFITANGLVSFGTEAKAIPADVKDYKDGMETVAKLKDLLDKIDWDEIKKNFDFGFDIDDILPILP